MPRKSVHVCAAETLFVVVSDIVMHMSTYCSYVVLLNPCRWREHCIERVKRAIYLAVEIEPIRSVSLNER